MTDPSDDEKRMTEIETRYERNGDFSSCAEIEVLFALARDGLELRKAAASNGEVEAASEASGLVGGGVRSGVARALQAAAAHRVAHGEDVDALKARAEKAEAHLDLARKTFCEPAEALGCAADSEEMLAAIEALKARVTELENEKAEAFNLGYKAAGGKIFPLGRVLAAREWP